MIQHFPQINSNLLYAIDNALQMYYPENGLHVECFHIKRLTNGRKVWINKNIGIVVKYPQFIGEPIPNFKIPTWERENYVIQPIAKTDPHSRSIALHEIKKHAKEVEFTDLHQFNVGIWNGKPVQFDW